MTTALTASVGRSDPIRRARRPAEDHPLFWRSEETPQPRAIGQRLYPLTT